jgi:hypothetical protein
MVAGAIAFHTAAAAPFSSPSDGFSIDLPPGWIQIPSAAIAETTREVARRAPNAPTPHYDYGFQFGSPDRWFTYPYVLVQVKRTGRIPESEFAKLDKFSTADTAARLQDKIREIATDVEIGKMRYDPTSRIIWVNTGGNVADVGRFSGVSAIVPTEFGLIQFNGYALEQEFMGFLTVFHEIIGSLSAADSARYRSRAADRVPFLSSIKWDSVLASALIGAIAGIAGFAFRSRRK